METSRQQQQQLQHEQPWQQRISISYSLSTQFMKWSVGIIVNSESQQQQQSQ